MAYLHIYLTAEPTSENVYGVSMEGILIDSVRRDVIMDIDGDENILFFQFFPLFPSLTSSPSCVKNIAVYQVMLSGPQHRTETLEISCSMNWIFPRSA